MFVNCSRHIVVAAARSGSISTVFKPIVRQWRARVQRVLRFPGV